MQTKSVKEKWWDTQLSSLNKKPLVRKATSVLDFQWMEEILSSSKEVSQISNLSLQDKKNLPTKEDVLLLFHFFRNCDNSKSNSAIAELVFVEINKYWQKSNIPIQTEWWVKKSILSFNAKYLDLLKPLNSNSNTEVSKRMNFQSSLKTLFDIASPEAELLLKKDKLLGKKKAEEDILFLESQRTDRSSKMVFADKQLEFKTNKHLKRKAQNEKYCEKVIEQ